MKRSSQVPAKLLMATAAAILAGCSGPTEVERCVDNYGNILPDSACETGYYAGGGGYYGGGGGVVIVPHYVYGGSVSGNRVSGFHSSPSGNAHVVNSSGRSISRGGFGSTGGGSFGRSGSFGG